MQRGVQLKLLLHGVALLLLAVLPFPLGAYRVGSVLLLLLLLAWPAACFLSPYLLARTGTRWFLALPPAPIFFILPLCVLLTPAGLAYLGAYPVLYALLAIAGTALGRWQHARKQARMRSGGMSF